MMATGYVHPVADGKITTLREFALGCSRGMGALVMMRDDPSGTPIPRQFEPDLGHYHDSLACAEQRLADLVALDTIEQRTAARNKEYNDREEGAKQRDAAARVEIDRVKAMRDKVVAWTGAPEGIKEFMLEQIDRSLKGAEDYREVDYLPPVKTVAEWYDDAFRKAAQEVGRVHEYIAAEKARTAGRNRWLEQLWASLESVE